MLISVILIFTLLAHVNRPYQYILNEYKHNQDVETTEYQKIDDIINQLKKEDKFILCTDSCIYATDVYNILIDCGKTPILITANSKPFIGSLDDYDQIIYSPKIIYGLDSSMKRPVFAVYKSDIISPTSMVQQITRCRNITHLYYFFSSKKFKYFSKRTSDDIKI